MSNSAQSRVALITGAAGGLGRGLVEQFLAAGWEVVAACHHGAEWSAQPRLSCVILDVSDAAQVESVTADVIAQKGAIDCLVHNAGITADELSWQLDDETFQRVLDVNLKAAFRCARAVCRPMMKKRDGQIIFMSSFAGRAGARGQSAYAAAKAGLLGLMESLARELGSRNIRVNAILPGVLPTAMTAGLSAHQMEAFARANVLGRINSVDEVARFVAFLAGTQNISGQLFQLDSRIAPWT